MGNICNTDSRLPDRHIRGNDDVPVFRFFMAGMASAGKSTIIRHLKYLCQKHKEYRYCNSEWREIRDFDDEDALMKKAIWENIVNVIDIFIKQVAINGEQFSSEDIKTTAEIVENLNEDKDEIPNYEMTDVFRNELVQLIEDPAFIHAMEMRNRIPKYQPGKEVFDGMDYFLTPQKIREVFHNDYIPSNNDKVHCRLPTTDIHRYYFRVNDYRIEIYDAGGQVSIRRHLPEILTAWKNNNTFSKFHEFVFFVTSIADYNVKHAEHDDYTLLQESEAFMEFLLSAGQLDNCGVLVFFNKCDRFFNKLDDPRCRDDIDYLSKYLNPADVRKYKESGRYDKNKMEEAVQKSFIDSLRTNFVNKASYCKSTCAVDPMIMEAFFGVIKTEISGLFEHIP